MGLVLRCLCQGTPVWRRFSPQGKAFGHKCIHHITKPQKKIFVSNNHAFGSREDPVIEIRSHRRLPQIDSIVVQDVVEENRGEQLTGATRRRGNELDIVSCAHDTNRKKFVKGASPGVSCQGLNPKEWILHKTDTESTLGQLGSFSKNPMFPKLRVIIVVHIQNVDIEEATQLAHQGIGATVVRTEDTNLPDFTCLRHVGVSHTRRQQNTIEGSDDELRIDLLLSTRFSKVSSRHGMNTP
mmetsp:Transcript_47839/g.126636  ORF Transcript_47839/g.126636 Transcript_47839/m.126636 type:complete len:240 (+) Transcript_47839:296-1015(+)